MEQEEIRLSEAEGPFDEDDAPNNSDDDSDAIHAPGAFATAQEYLDVSEAMSFNYHLILFYSRSSKMRTS